MKNKIYKTAHIYRHYHTLSDSGLIGYIGETVTLPEERWKLHVYGAFSKCESNKRDYKTPFKRAIRKYTPEVFVMEILEVLKDVSKEDIHIREKYWIKFYDSYKNGYNASIGGGGVIFWDEDSILEEALKYKRKSDFQKFSGGARKAAIRIGIYKKVTSHMECGYSVDRKWNKDNIKEEALRYIHKSDFNSHSGSAVNAAKRLGIYKEVTSHMIPKI